MYVRLALCPGYHLSLTSPLRLKEWCVERITSFKISKMNGHPRERLRHRLVNLGKTLLGLRSTSLPNRPSDPSRRAYSPSKNDVDVRSAEVESTKTVQTVVAPNAQAEPKAQAGGNIVTHEKATHAQKQDKLQEKDEGRNVTDETAGGSKAQDGGPKEDGDKAAGSAMELPDFWALANKKLRVDSSKRKIMEKFDSILEEPENIGSALEPPGTKSRQQRIDAYITSKIKNLESAEDQNRLSQCKENAKSFFRIAVKCVKATQGLISAATAPCLPASVACAGVTVLLTASLVIQYYI
jgi:hypothetical protein